MKKNILVFCLLVLSFTFIRAQALREYYFATFEDGSAEGFSGGTVVDNPMIDEINSSTKSLFSTAGQWWGPGKWSNNGHFFPVFLKLKVDIYLPEGALQYYSWHNEPVCAIILHGRNCADDNSAQWQSESVLLTQEGNWTSVEFDLNSLENYCYRNLIIASSSPQGFYLDNIRWVVQIDDLGEEVIFEESFEGAVFPPSNWSLHSLGASSPNWVRSAEKNKTSWGNYSLKHTVAGFNQVENWVVTPAISLPDSGSYDLSFFSLSSDNYHYSPNAGNSSRVYISTTGNNPAVDNFQLIWQAASVNDFWEEINVSLQEYVGHQVFIAFVFNGSGLSHNWFVDEIKVVRGEPRIIIEVGNASGCAANIFTFEFFMKNPIPVVAFQLDLLLPQGFSYIEASEALHRDTNHEVYTNVLNDSILRVIAFSMDNSTFAGSDGLFLTFDIHASVEPGMHYLKFLQTIVSDSWGANKAYKAFDAPITLNPATTVINAQPQSIAVNAGQTAVIQIGAQGDNLHYQWFFNNEPIQQATESTLVLSNVNMSMQGAYFCRVSGDCGIIDSQIAQLTVKVYGVNFSVKNSLMQGLENAEIKISQQYILYTDSSGEAQIELVTGSYPFVISIEGYHTHSGLFFVSNNSVNIPVVLLHLGSDEMFVAEELVYPNPFKDFLVIKNPGGLKNFVLTDLPGRKLLGGSFDNLSEVTINLAFLAEGFYLLTLNGENDKAQTIRLLKK